jgi:hypothetical protein
MPEQHPHHGRFGPCIHGKAARPFIARFHRAHPQPLSRPVLNTRPQQMPGTATRLRGAQLKMARTRGIAGVGRDRQQRRLPKSKHTDDAGYADVYLHGPRTGR